MYLIWIFGSKLIRSNNQSRATLWVRDTCLIVGFLLFMIILITASLSSNTYNKASWCEEWTLEETRSTLSKSLITLWDCLRLVYAHGSCGGKQQVSPFYHGSELSFKGLKQSDPINQEREYRLISILPQKRWFWFCWIVWNWSLLLAHPTDWNKCMTSKKCGGVLFGQGGQALQRKCAGLLSTT